MKSIKNSHATNPNGGGWKAKRDHKKRGSHGYKVIISELNLFSRTGWICRFISRQGVQRTFINYFGDDEKLTVEILPFIVILPKAFRLNVFGEKIWKQIWNFYEFYFWELWNISPIDVFLLLAWQLTRQHPSENPHTFLVSDSKKNQIKMFTEKEELLRAFSMKKSKKNFRLTLKFPNFS